MDGDLKLSEPHTASLDAFDWVKNWLRYNLREAFQLREALASTALAGNRMSQICRKTLRRIMNGEPVSDRYLLGLAWYLKNIKEKKL